MKNIKQYHTFINENSSVNKITANDLEKLFNDDMIIINNNSIKNGINIYMYDLIRLAQGALISVEGCNIVLEDGIDFKTIRNIVRKSPLNDEGAMFSIFLETHPMKKN